MCRRFPLTRRGSQKMKREGGPRAKNGVRVEVDFSLLEIREMSRLGRGRVGGERGRTRRRVSGRGRGGGAGGGGLRAASAPVLSLPPQTLEDKWRGQLSFSLFPSPAGRGSAPGWWGGGPDACDWPRPHLGRRAPPPPSCWEQLLLSRLGAALGRSLGFGAGPGVGLGIAGGGLALSVACSNPSKSWGLGAAPAETQGAGTAPKKGDALLSKSKTRALCVRLR